MESRLRHLVVDALFPRFCLSCHTEGTLWCEACASVWWPSPVRFGCPFCGKGTETTTCASCRSQTYLDGLFVFASYGNPVVRNAITQWKYDGDRGIEKVIQNWLWRAHAHLIPIGLEETIFVPVPLHLRKRRTRGFDQAGLLADWLGQLYSTPVFDLLVRSRMTPPQAQQEKQMRKLGNLDGIFRLHPTVDSIPKRIILCDDVFTSGATMDAAAKCLKEAGVKEVWGCVIAKGNP